jgi:peptidoglycan/xylan/chitin deacetylase (PgdA/CDA1 family)
MSVSTFLQNSYRRFRTTLLGRRSLRLTNQTPIISFTFDDFPRTALHTGGEILQKYGVAGTYYTALGLMDTDGPVGRLFAETDLREVVSRGHELGCHTFDHYDTLNTHPKTFEDSILRNRDALSRLLPGASFPTLSYPLSIPLPQTKRRMGKHFLGCRGGFQEINRETADLNFLKSFFLEQCGGDFDLVKHVVDQNRQAGGWLIFSTHDIADKPSRFGCTTQFFADVVRYSVDSGAVILPVGAAIEKLRRGNF